MRVYEMDTQALSDFADQMKVIVLLRLVKDGLLADAKAEEWAKHHTIIGRRKNIFRTITRLWEETEEAQGIYWGVVSDE